MLEKMDVLQGDVDVLKLQVHKCALTTSLDSFNGKL